ncbi:hypothetical protein T296_20120 [Pantoea agglomerans Eh318]|nr:hypothetical protein T296_20120 [Pantoea agglomerans Eh318]
MFFRPLDLTDAGLFIFDLKPSGAWRGLPYRAGVRKAICPGALFIQESKYYG